MARKKKVLFCENHPDIATSDNCEHCDKNICYNCRRIFVHRIFCSRRCINAFIANHARRLFLKALKRILWIFTWPVHGLLKVQRWRVIEWALVAGLCISIFLNIQMKHDLQSLKTIVVTGETGEAVVDTTLLPPVEQMIPAEGGMVQSNRIDIAGMAEENWIVTLSKDDQIIAVQLPENGKFLFKNVQLIRGQNALVVRALNQEGKVTILQTLHFTYGMPTYNYLIEEVNRGPLGNRFISFTFDGGAENNAAEDILDFLKEAKVKSTFFLTGKFIQNYPKTVRRIVAEGHEVGNHTMNHPHLTTFEQNRKHQTHSKMTREKLQEELSKTAQMFELVTKKKISKIWRAPYGERNPEILKWAAEAGYKHIGWTVGRGWEENMDTMDWVTDKDSNAYHSAEEIAKKILAYADNKRSGADGAIILMHLGTNRTEDYPHKKLPDILSGMQKKGYEAVTVSEMLNRH